jgi:murein DD-endopeptidase MepM/ murein hydrolase activator NlpD
MSYRSFFISFLVFFLLSPVLVIGIDTTTSGRILDAFKREEYAMLFENAPFDQSGATEIYQKEYILNGLDGLRKKLEATTKIYQEKKDDTTKRKTTLEEAITSIENNIADTVAWIYKTEKSIETKNSHIEEYQDLSLQLSIRIKKNRATILSYLANIYSEGSLVFDKNNQLDIFQTLILTEDDSDTVSKDIVYKSLISIVGQKFIEDYRDLIRQYHLTQSRIREEVALIKADQDLLERQKSTLLSQREYKQQLLDATKWQEQLYAQYIDVQIQTQIKVEEAWKNAANQYTVSLENLLTKNGCQKEKKSIQDMEKCANILSFYRNERALKTIDISTWSTNVMAWPVHTIESISAFYKDPSYYREVWSQHDAIDIPVSQWTDIIAPMDGYVQYILPPVSWGYSYLALKHPDGYVTVYGHLSEILVFPYQFVRKGDRIAKSGGAPGTPGAGPMTSGAHLHFEVWKNRATIDPLRVLDISQLDYTLLPARYQDKFITDIVGRAGTWADLSQYDRKFIIKWDTEESRQKYLLKTYATPDFQNWNTWIDTALSARIDPSFLMCVWLAETTLGNHLKTAYNIGNVGNTDSGDTASFSSAKEGIAWMAATFNNRYLSQYNHVSELSRWWNRDGIIYASSNANWHNNIIRCISSLQWRFVEDDYNIRVKQE